MNTNPLIFNLRFRCYFVMDFYVNRKHQKPCNNMYTKYLLGKQLQKYRRFYIKSTANIQHTFLIVHSDHLPVNACPPVNT